MRSKIRSPVPQPFTAAHEKLARKYEHHLLLKMAGDGVGEAKSGWWIISNRPKAISLSVRRRRQQSVFTPFRRCGRSNSLSGVHSDEVEDILALDIALRRNEPSGMSIYRRRSTASWCTSSIRPFYVLCLPSGLHSEKRRGVHALKEQMLELLQQRGAQYPPSITSVICIKHRRRCRSSIGERSDQQHESGDR